MYDFAGNAGVASRIDDSLLSGTDMPSVAALADGGWVVTWHVARGGSDYDVFQQVFAADGSSSGTDILVNETTAEAQLFSSITALDNGGWVVTWETNHNGASNDIYQRVFTPSNATTLTAAQDVATGTALGESLEVPLGTLGVGDQLNGGGGTDILALTGAGMHDLTVAATILNFEILAGTAGDDTIRLNAASLAAFPTINGGDGGDTVALTGPSVNLNGRKFQNVETVFWADGTFSAAQRLQLHLDGATTVEDKTGLHVGQAPTDILLSGTAIAENSTAGTKVADLTAVDGDAADVHAFALIENPNGFFAIAGNTLVVAAGAKLDADTDDTHQVKIRVTD